MPGQIKLQTQTFTTKLTRPTDATIGNKTKSQVGKPYTGANSKLFRFIPSRLDDKTKDRSKEQATYVRPSLKKNLLKKQSHESKNSVDSDLMLIDETIDLVGSDENVHRNNNEALKKDVIDLTFDIMKKDGTFIKSPAGSMNNLIGPKDKDLPRQRSRDLSKSRDSLFHLTQGLSLLSSIRSPKNWGSDELLNRSRDSSRKTMDNTQVFSSTMLNNQLLDITPAKPFLLNLTADNTQVPSTTMLLCMSQQQTNASNTLVCSASQMETVRLHDKYFSPLFK